jgi:regulator of replication initiation timing
MFLKKEKRTMPRKQKDVYEKISIMENKINQLETQLKDYKTKLVALNKEREELEMKKLFEYTKENKLSCDDVIRAINLYSIKQVAK